MILIGFTSSLAQFGARCSIQGPGLCSGSSWGLGLGSGPRCLVQGTGAQFRGQGLVQGPGARFGARGSVQGPGAWFMAQVLGSGARAWFGAQVLNSGPRAGPAKRCLLGTEFQKCLLLRGFWRQKRGFWRKNKRYLLLERGLEAV